MKTHEEFLRQLAFASRCAVALNILTHVGIALCAIGALAIVMGWLP